GGGPDGAADLGAVEQQPQHDDDRQGYAACDELGDGQADVGDRDGRRGVAQEYRLRLGAEQEEQRVGYDQRQPQGREQRAVAGGVDEAREDEALDDRAEQEPGR